MTPATTLAEKMAEEYYPTSDDPTTRYHDFYRKEGFKAGYAAAHQWIPVTPETEIEEKRLLQFYTKKMNILATGFFIKEGDDIKDDSIFYAEHGGGHCKRKNVSHYRYLDTTPPKQSNEKK